MAKHDVPVVRIVVDGCPAPRSIGTNVPQARGMLLRAFENDRWPGKALFAVTPGGFIVAPFPCPWKGESGWESGTDDFEALVERAKEVVGEVLTSKVLGAARGRAEFLTLGVDLNHRSGKRKMDRKSRGACGHHRCREGRGGAVDRQVVPDIVAGRDAGPGSEPELPPA